MCFQNLIHMSMHIAFSSYVMDIHLGAGSKMSGFMSGRDADSSGR